MPSRASFFFFDIAVDVPHSFFGLVSSLAGPWFSSFKRSQHTSANAVNFRNDRSPVPLVLHNFLPVFVIIDGIDESHLGQMSGPVLVARLIV